MARITPAGFQNHIQNPLAAVMYAIMNGAMDNARDARRTDYEIAQDRQQQQNRDLERWLSIAMNGGRVTDADARANPMVAAATGIGSDRMQQDREDRAMKLRDQNRTAAESAQRMRLAQSEDQRRTAAAASDIGNTWADNVGGIGKYLGDVLLGRGASRHASGDQRVQTVQDPNTGKTYAIVQTPNGIEKREIPIAQPAAPTAPAAGVPGAVDSAEADPIADRIKFYLSRAQANGAAPYSR